MVQPTTLDVRQQPLLTTFMGMLQPFRTVCRQARPFQRLCALALAAVLNPGSQTITGQLSTLGSTSDWTAFYRLFNRSRLEIETCFQHLTTTALALLPEDGPCVVAVDSTQIERTSWRMVGTSWLYNPRSPVFKRGIHRAQRWVHLAWLVPPNALGYSRAIPLRLDPAVPEKGRRPPGMEARKEWEVGLDQLGWMRAELDAAGRGDQLLLATADSTWQGAAVWNGLPERTVLVAGCRANRALYALPARTPGPGRPRRYGERAPSPGAWLSVRQGRKQLTLTMRGRTIPVAYQVHGPYLVKGAPERPLLLLVVHGSQPGRGRKVRRARFWLVNAVERNGRWESALPVADLLRTAWQRWEIEVTHREMKTTFGVGDGQSWGDTSAFLTVQWQVTIYSLLLLAAYRCWGLSPGRVPPRGPWYPGARRWSLEQVRRAMRSELGTLAEFRPGWAGTPGNWWKIADWLTGQRHLVTGFGRSQPHPGSPGPVSIPI